jgi:glycerol-3-phosphate acyltransferase PlsY
MMSWTEHLRSANWNEASALFAFAYLLGCFTGGYYLVRWLAHQDIRTIGSGGVGARNVSRVLGKPGFLLTVLADGGKGLLAVWVARHFTADSRLVLLSMLAVVAGHLWPAQLRFRGGKGMATSLGALLAFNPWLALAFAVVFVVLAAALRRTVLPAMTAIAVVPMVAFWLGAAPTDVVLLSLLSGLVIAGHRRNLMEELLHLASRRPLDPKPDQTHL